MKKAPQFFSLRTEPRNSGYWVSFAQGPSSPQCVRSIGLGSCNRSESPVWRSHIVAFNNIANDRLSRSIGLQTIKLLRTEFISLIMYSVALSDSVRTFIELKTPLCRFRLSSQLHLKTPNKIKLKMWTHLWAHPSENQITRCFYLKELG